MPYTLDNYAIDSCGIGGASYADCALLMHFDGTNGSTTMTDTMGHTATAYGNAQISTSIPKFGTGSLLLDGSGDYVLVADSDDFILGSGNFTIDCWIKLPSGFTSSSRYCIFSHFSDTSANYMLFEIVQNRLSFVAVSGGAKLLEYYTTAITWVTGAWYHIAVVRNGSSMKIYVNGTSQTIDTGFYYTAFSNGTFPNYTGSWQIGMWSSSYRYFKGNIDDFRIMHRALWTADFTPPATAA